MMKSFPVVWMPPDSFSCISSKVFPGSNPVGALSTVTRYFGKPFCESPFSTMIELPKYSMFSSGSASLSFPSFHAFACVTNTPFSS